MLFLSVEFSLPSFSFRRLWYIHWAKYTERRHGIHCSTERQNRRNPMPHWTENLNRLDIFSQEVAICTVADTCLVFYFLEVATRCEYKAVLTFATCLNISNAFESLKTLFRYCQRVLNIWNAFWIFATRFKHWHRVLNICYTFETFNTRFKY